MNSIDIMPTVLELLDAPMPEKARNQLRGRSHVPAMRGEAPTGDLFFETDYRLHTFKRGILTPTGMKLIVTLETKGREFYDLNADPAESKNLAAERPEVTAELEKKLFEHFRTIGHDLTAREWNTGFNPVYTFPAKGPKK